MPPDSYPGLRQQRHDHPPDFRHPGRHRLLPCDGHRGRFHPEAPHEVGSSTPLLHDGGFRGKSERQRLRSPAASQESRCLKGDPLPVQPVASAQVKSCRPAGRAVQRTASYQSHGTGAVSQEPHRSSCSRSFGARCDGGKARRQSIRPAEPVLCGRLLYRCPATSPSAAPFSGGRLCMVPGSEVLLRQRGDQSHQRRDSARHAGPWAAEVDPDE